VTDPANPGQPYGGQPYGGQPGQPYGGQSGEAHSGQPAYGAPQPPAPGSPYSGYSGEAPAPYPGGPVPPPPAKKGGAGKIIGIILGAVVLLIALCVGGGALLLNKAKTDPANAKVGNCLAGATMDSNTAQEVNNIKVVDCTASDAKYKVVGVVPDKTRVEWDTDKDICSTYPTAESTLWQGAAGKAGSVLCLEPVKK
jgi:hypothetical protein